MAAPEEDTRGLRRAGRKRQQTVRYAVESASLARSPSSSPKPCRTVPPGPGGEPEAAGDSNCDVCGGGDSTEGDSILYCDGCDVGVHQSCYGIAKIPKGKWFCKLCQGKVQDTAECVICLQSKGAMKKTKDGKWAHVQCVWIDPECEVQDTSRMEPLLVPASVLKARKGRKCQFCQQLDGLCLSCSWPECDKVFHGRCAREKDGFLRIGVELGQLAVEGYCGKHKNKRGGAQLVLDHLINRKVANRTLKSKVQKIRDRVTAGQSSLNNFTEDVNSILHSFKAILKDKAYRELHQSAVSQLSNLRKILRADEPALGKRPSREEENSAHSPKKKVKTTESKLNLKGHKTAQQDKSDDVAKASDGDEEASVAYENVVCAVCCGGATAVGNDILFCDICDVAVHQKCYGIQKVPEGDWLCAPCAAGEESLNLKCVGCNKRGGALKAVGRRWVHMACVLVDSSMRIEDVRTMEPVECMHPGCSQRFHALCAHRRGRFEVAFYFGQVFLETYCDSHKSDSYTISSFISFLEEEVVSSAHAKGVKQLKNNLEQGKLETLDQFEAAALSLANKVADMPGKNLKHDSQDFVREVERRLHLIRRSVLKKSGWGSRERIGEPQNILSTDPSLYEGLGFSFQFESVQHRFKFVTLADACLGSFLQREDVKAFLPPCWQTFESLDDLRRPLGLSTLRVLLRNGAYQNPYSLLSDVCKVFLFVMQSREEDSEAYADAEYLLRLFRARYQIDVLQKCLGGKFKRDSFISRKLHLSTKKSGNTGKVTGPSSGGKGRKRPRQPEGSWPDKSRVPPIFTFTHDAKDEARRRFTDEVQHHLNYSLIANLEDEPVVRVSRSLPAVPPLSRRPMLKLLTTLQTQVLKEEPSTSSSLAFSPRQSEPISHKVPHPNISYPPPAAQDEPMRRVIEESREDSPPAPIAETATCTSPDPPTLRQDTDCANQHDTNADNDFSVPAHEEGEAKTSPCATHSPSLEKSSVQTTQEGLEYEAIESGQDTINNLKPPEASAAEGETDSIASCGGRQQSLSLLSELLDEVQKLSLGSVIEEEVAQGCHCLTSGVGPGKPILARVLRDYKRVMQVEDPEAALEALEARCARKAQEKEQKEARDETEDEEEEGDEDEASEAGSSFSLLPLHQERGIAGALRRTCGMLTGSALKQQHKGIRGVSGLLTASMLKKKLAAKAPKKPTEKKASLHPLLRLQKKVPAPSQSKRIRGAQNGDRESSRKAPAVGIGQLGKAPRIAQKAPRGISNPVVQLKGATKQKNASATHTVKPKTQKKETQKKETQTAQLKAKEREVISPKEDAVIVTKATRSVRCGACPGCQMPDCGLCNNCMDKADTVSARPPSQGTGCSDRLCQTTAIVQLRPVPTKVTVPPSGLVPAEGLFERPEEDMCKDFSLFAFEGPVDERLNAPVEPGYAYSLSDPFLPAH